MLFFFCCAFFFPSILHFISFAFTFNLKPRRPILKVALKAFAIKIMNRLADIEGEIDASGCGFWREDVPRTKKRKLKFCNPFCFNAKLTLAKFNFGEVSQKCIYENFDVFNSKQIFPYKFLCCDISGLIICYAILKTT